MYAWYSARNIAFVLSLQHRLELQLIQQDNTKRKNDLAQIQHHVGEKSSLDPVYLGSLCQVSEAVTS